VLSVLAMGVSLTLTAVILRERRGPVRAVAGAAPDERDEAGDVQDVEFYGPAPAGSDPDEDDDAQAPATGEGRQRRSLVKRPS